MGGGHTAIVRRRESLTYGDRMSAKIINRGRGPEIEGTRITVYDVLDYARQGWHRDRIAALFRLSSRDIQEALDYIDQHQDEVTANYQTMRARQKNYPYTPDIAAKIAVSRQRAQARLAALKSSRLGEQEEPYNGQHHG
jgi:uncharacterized protein (DUF433 family)